MRVSFAAQVWLYHQSLPLVDHELASASTLVPSRCAARNHRRQYEAWEPPSTTWVPETEEEYNNFFEQVRNKIPKERLFEWDPRVNTMEELCDFLQIRPCPKTGRTGRAINTWIFERDFPIASMSANMLRLFLHWVNWKLCCGLVGLLFRCCRRQVNASHQKPD